MFSKQDLEKVMEEAGVGERTRKRMRQAHEALQSPGTPESSRPSSRPAKGHGAPAEEFIPVASI